MAQDYGKKSGMPVKKMADGGSVGLWERLKAGNIDDSSSEAYHRWGAGSRGGNESPAESVRLASRVPTPAAAPAPAPAPKVEEAFIEPGSGPHDGDGPKARDRRADARATERAAERRPVRKVAPKPVGRPAVSDSYRSEGRNSPAPVAKKPGEMSQSERSAYHRSTLDDMPLVRGIKSVLGIKAGGEPTNTPDKREEGLRRIGEQIRNRTADSVARAGVGMKDGGMVGGKRKC